MKTGCQVLRIEDTSVLRLAHERIWYVMLLSLPNGIGAKYTSPIVPTTLMHTVTPAERRIRVISAATILEVMAERAAGAGQTPFRGTCG